MKIDLNREEIQNLREWHEEAAPLAATELDYIQARYHQERAEDLQDPRPVVEGSLRELADRLMQMTRDHPCASQALGIVSNCADHLRAVACCLDAAKKEAE